MKNFKNLCDFASLRAKNQVQNSNFKPETKFWNTDLKNFKIFATLRLCEQKMKNLKIKCLTSIF